MRHGRKISRKMKKKKLLKLLKEKQHKKKKEKVKLHSYPILRFYMLAREKLNKLSNLEIIIVLIFFMFAFQLFIAKITQPNILVQSQTVMNQIRLWNGKQVTLNWQILMLIVLRWMQGCWLSYRPSIPQGTYIRRR